MSWLPASLKTIFRSEVTAEAHKYDFASATVNQRKLSDLPCVLRNYLVECGYDETEKTTYCNIKWASAWLKMKPNTRWLPLDCSQVNFVTRPARIVFMKTKLFGIFPLYARDKYQDGKGNMLVKLFNYFTVTNAKGKEMDEAELVTVLAETILLPIYALQPYITWTELGAHTIKGTIRDGATEVSGIFFFNEKNEFLRFETNDRYYSEQNTYRKIRWTVFAKVYIKQGGIKFPSVFNIVWNLPEGDHTYFKGVVGKLELNSFS